MRRKERLSTPLLEPGAPAPDITVVHPDGTTRELAELRGHPCVVAVGLTSDTQAATWRAIVVSGERLHIPVVNALDSDSARRFGALSGSAAFLIDAGGIVRWSQCGPISSAATPGWDPTRREFLAMLLAASVGAMLAGEGTVAAATGAAASRTLPITLDVNGKSHRLLLDPRVTLLDALREHLRFTGSKKGCDHGQCGACTVHVDGRRVLSCLTLAAAAQGVRVTTIEGIGRDSALHPMQSAFIEHDGFQCGYCTSGQIMSAVALLGEPCGPTDADVRECMSGNLCRCGAYPNIVAAVQSVRRGTAQRS